MIATTRDEQGIDLADSRQASPSCPGEHPRPVYVPSGDEVKSELWRIASGDGSESSRVAALRILADVLGLMKPESSEIPEAMTALLDAVSAGMAQREGSGESQE